MESSLHFLFEASPIIFAHDVFGHVDLTVAQIRDILEGRITKWSVIGRGGEAIQPMCNTAPVQNAVFRTYARQSFCVKSLRGDMTGGETYERLAFEANKRPGSLVFGLRPEFALGTSLRPISIAGTWPGKYVRHRYPSLQVWLSVRNGCSAAAIAHYLNEVAGRIERDVATLQAVSDEPVSDPPMVRTHRRLLVGSN